MPLVLPRWLVPCLALLLSFAAAHYASAQLITLSEGVQTYASLTAATVTLSGNSELRLTAATPLSSSIINLTSPNSWVLFTSVKPSVVVSTYLAQLRVNSAAAVSGYNVRVVQYELGAMVIPQAPSYEPLQAFTGRDFSGSSRTFAQYTYYNSATALGTFNRDISSFKLKRGYMATFSTQTNGSGPSQVYIAQDADLEIGRLPSSMDNAIRFVRVFPWRWVSKKGSADVGPTTLNATWHYNWDNNLSSALDWEYVPIRQQRWWPAYPTNKPDSTHVLGYNEPDNPVEDSYTSLNNGSVDTAIAVWPELLASGLRIGSPVTTDGGLSWLYDFMTKADAAKLRVDYVAVHFYRCGFTASQLYDWLYAIHVQTGRPLWVTEFNNGADWTTCTDPSYAQNATRIGELIAMMDDTPWIERYSIYSKVEYMRQMTYDTGGLTPAGIAYRDNVAPMSYVQRLPRTGSRALTQLALDGDTLDSSGQGNNAIAVGRPAFASGRTGQALRLDGTTQHLQLPPDVAGSSSFSFAAWVYWDGGASWQRIFDFGKDTSRYLFLTTSATGGHLRFATRNSGSEQTVQTATALPIGQWTHVAVTLAGGTARLYVNGTEAANGPISITPSQVSADLNYLGKSRFSADPLFAGLLDDVRIADYAFTPAQITAMQGANVAPQFASATIVGGSATQNQPYSGSLAGSATDADPADSLTYAKVSGPSWLLVAADGTLSGTPGFANDGPQEFVVSATDATGASDSAVLAISMPYVIGNGTWLTDTDGNWSDVLKWTSSFPANGANASANFSTLDITADRSVTLDSSRGIGSLSFGDNSGAQSWTLLSADGASLTLDTGSSTSPAIAVNQNTATLALPLEGSNGFSKSGAGTLVLAGGGSISGLVNIDNASSTAAQGVVRVAHSDAIADVSTLQIRTNNSGSSTLELSAALGDIATSASLSLNGRNNTVPAVRNLSGLNTLGVLSVQIGGANYLIQSDAGNLVLGGLTSGASGTRTVTFSGAGDFTLAGVASNGSATTGLVLVKNGAGRLSLTASNTFTGNLTVNGGTLAISNTGSLYAGAWNNSAVLTLNAGSVLELDRWGYGITDTTYRTQALGGLSYNPARFIINGGTLRYTGGAAGVPQNPAESPYGPGFTIGAGGATLEAAKAGDTWTVKSDSRGGGNITSTAGGALTLAGVGDGIFDKVLSGTGSLVKTGPGVWTLPLANTYTGPTSVNAGTLRVTGSTASGAVNVNTGGSLTGTGSLAGATAILSGGLLAPGSDGVGTLTFSGNLTLVPGSSTRLELNRAAATRDQLVVGGTLSLGGALEVTNLGGTLAAGDSFLLFTAGLRSGSFATLALPALPSLLAWDSSTLDSNGTLRVLALPGFADWIAPRGLPVEAAAFAADPDGDGLANALEWLLGGDPVISDAAAHHPQLALRALDPAEYPAAIAGRTYLTLTTRVLRSRPGATFIPEAATTVAGLTAPGAAAAAAPVGLPVADGAFDLVTYVFTTPLEDTPTGTAFLRLRVVQD